MSNIEIQQKELKFIFIVLQRNSKWKGFYCADAVILKYIRREDISSIFSDGKKWHSKTKIMIKILFATFISFLLSMIMVLNCDAFLFVCNNYKQIIKTFLTSSTSIYFYVGSLVGFNNKKRDTFPLYLEDRFNIFVRNIRNMR